jgi:hypothetical protein
VFASYIFNTRDVENNAGETSTLGSTRKKHMQRFSAQYERGYPVVPKELLESLSVEYQKFHEHNPRKVVTSRTNQLMRNCAAVPAVFRQAADRVSKELRGESIPEYTEQEINVLLNQRERLLRSSNGSVATFNNQVYLRQFGRANDMEISRLFPHAKTNSVHVKRMRTLEDACDAHKGLKNMSHQEGNVRWDMHPST